MNVFDLRKPKFTGSF